MQFRNALVLAAIIVCPTFYPLQADAQNSDQFTFTTDTPTPQAAPLDISISITSPDTLELYIENKPVTLLVKITNIGDKPLSVEATGTLTKLDSEFRSDIFGTGGNIPAKGAISSQTSQVLSAGTYSLTVLAGADADGYQSRAAEFVFTISTTQDILLKQQAQSSAESTEIARLSLYVAIISVLAGVGTAITAIIVNKKRSN